MSGTFTARPRSVPHCFWPVPLRLPAPLRFLHWQQDVKDAVSKWRALRRRGDPGTDIPDSLPRNTRVGSLPRKIGTVNHIRSAPERGLPFWVGPSEPCIKTGARWAEPKWGTSSLVFILQALPREQVMIGATCIILYLFLQAGGGAGGDAGQCTNLPLN